MASFTTGPDERFRPGTTLHAYPATGGGRPTTPIATSTTTVQADSTATFTGLDDGTRYVAGTSPAGPFISFSTPVATSTEDGVSAETLYAALAISNGFVDETEDGWPDRPALFGQEMPFQLKWRTLPGSTSNPVDKMSLAYNDAILLTPTPPEEA